MAKPNSGELNQRIEIERLTQTQDTEGGMVDAWTNVFGSNAKIWAKRNNLSGTTKRATEAGGAVVEARTEFTIRYRAGITNTMRIKHAGEVFNITHVNNYMQANEWLIISCSTGVNDGR